MAATKRKTSAKPKRERISREELAQLKAALGEQLENIYHQVMGFCRGAPPQDSGEWQLSNGA